MEDTNSSSAYNSENIGGGTIAAGLGFKNENRNALFEKTGNAWTQMLKENEMHEITARGKSKWVHSAHMGN